MKASLFWTTWAQNLSKRTKAISLASHQPFSLAEYSAMIVETFLLSPVNVRHEVQQTIRIHTGKKLYTAVHSQHFQPQEMYPASPVISKILIRALLFYYSQNYHPKTFLTTSRVMQHLCKDYSRSLIVYLKSLEINCISLATTFPQRTERLWNIDLRIWTETHFNAILLFRLILYMKKYWNLWLCHIVYTGTHKCLCRSLKQSIAERKVSCLSLVV